MACPSWQPTRSMDGGTGTRSWAESKSCLEAILSRNESESSGRDDRRFFRIAFVSGGCIAIESRLKRSSRFNKASTWVDRDGCQADLSHFRIATCNRPIDRTFGRTLAGSNALLESCGRMVDLRELATWKKSRADERVSDRLLQHAIEILRQMHGIAMRWGSESIVAPGMVERLERWIAMVDDSTARFLRSRRRGLWNLQMLDASLGGDPRQWIEQAIDTMQHHYLETSRRLEAWTRRTLPCHWIVRDAWRENVLVIDDQVTGVIDFGAARIDWPGFDLVRWIGGWLEPDDERLRSCVRLIQ